MSNSTGSHSENDLKSLTYYPFFDWLRLVLASIVVWDHADFQIAPFLSGGLAVKVFFALSGWLIGGILMRSHSQDLPRFFYNRATRIWIPYFLAIAFIYLLAVIIEGANLFFLKYLVLDLTFTHQIFTLFPAARYEMPLQGSGNQFWSISVEEQFYLIAPLIMLFVGRGKSLIVWVPIAVATMVLDWHAAPISLGVCAAILQAHLSIADKASTRWAAFAIAALCAIAMSIWHFTYIFGPIFGVATVVACAWPGRRDRISANFGGLSYPLYLNHWMAAFVVHFLQKHTVGFGKMAYVIADYGVALLLAQILYLCVDRNIQLWRNRFYKPTIGKRITIFAYAIFVSGLITGSIFDHYGPHATVPAGEGSSAARHNLGLVGHHLHAGSFHNRSSTPQAQT